MNIICTLHGGLCAHTRFSLHSDTNESCARPCETACIQVSCCTQLRVGVHHGTGSNQSVSPIRPSQQLLDASPSSKPRQLGECIDQRQRPNKSDPNIHPQAFHFTSQSNVHTEARLVCIVYIVYVYSYA